MKTCLNDFSVLVFIVTIVKTIFKIFLVRLLRIACRAKLPWIMSVSDVYCSFLLLLWGPLLPKFFWGEFWK